MQLVSSRTRENDDQESLETRNNCLKQILMSISSNPNYEPTRQNSFEAEQGVTGTPAFPGFWYWYEDFVEPRYEDEWIVDLTCYEV
ncbi:hypothetical protein Ccrd_012882 [Cynara cardunculus var. scolymus]|uniref:Uncharacterized protein n=1 Tax=Cynara cardunculus var. scolymus TaxID=59895 RepID=A0A103YGQ5_CYNCS|nr:hypothetical protein Ccrd_012882 [Cynara cardunculus var. scolymus]